MIRYNKLVRCFVTAFVSCVKTIKESLIKNFYRFFQYDKEVNKFIKKRSNQTEKRVIASKSGAVLGLDAALEHRHMGETYTVNGRTFDMRAEVGLLTRNIKIVG